MRFWITLEGRDAEVEFRTEGERLWVEVEGRQIEADFHRLPDGEVYSLLVNGRSELGRWVHSESGGAGGGDPARQPRPTVTSRRPAASRAASRPTFAHRTRRQSAGAPPARRPAMPA